uniref:Uncharacterized protein n=1 Tax=Anguilla anguilla TaxID=7936 RepID=A0A0E9R4P2_ANGAN
MICGYSFNGMSGFTVRWDGGYFMLPIRHRQKRNQLFVYTCGLSHFCSSLTVSQYCS